MTVRYVGSASAGNNDGSSWANRYGTLNAAEDTPVVAGDFVWVGPGVYRETLTCDVSGASGYSTGTIAVTNKSATVTGTGTSFVGGSVAASDYLHVRYYDNGTAGSYNGASAFSCATGNFQAAMVGMPIQINGVGAFVIAGVSAATSMTLTDPNKIETGTSAGDQTWSIMSGEGHYQIESVDDDTQLTLKQPWQGKTLEGLDYTTFRAITYAADVTGEHTDGVGGVVRITGSDNDQTATRTSGINVNQKSYRVFRGFYIDTTSDSGILDSSSGNLHYILEDVIIQNCANYGVRSFQSEMVTIRRCLTLGRAATSCFYFEHDTGDNDAGHVIENTRAMSGYRFCWARKTFGITITNCISYGNEAGITTTTGATSGGCVYIRNGIVCNTFGTGFNANAAGQIIEDYNNVFSNGTNYTNTSQGSNTVLYTPLFSVPILHAGTDQLNGYKFPWHFGDLSQWSALRAITGIDERNTDMYGIPRPTTAAKNSWGPVQYSNIQRETSTIRSGCAAIKLGDAGTHQLFVPTTNEETTISVYVYRAGSYAGATCPTMILSQPGQEASSVTDTGASGAWNQLTQTWTPASPPSFTVVDLVSYNTATCTGHEVYFDDLSVS